MVIQNRFVVINLLHQWGSKEPKLRELLIFLFLIMYVGM